MRLQHVFLLLGLVFLFSCADVMEPTGDPVSMSISPSSASISKGQTKRFTVLAYDNKGNFVDVNPTWSVQNNLGIISSSGIFFALLEAPGPFPKTEYITATYQNLSSTVPIIIKLAPLGIYTETYPELHYDRCPLSETNDHEAVIMLAWDDGTAACNLTPSYGYGEYTEGTRGLKIDITGTGHAGVAIKYAVFSNCPAGFPGGIYDNLGRDLSAYSNGKITFDIKCETANDFYIKVEENDGIPADDYERLFFSQILGIAPDNQWHHCEILLNNVTPSLANDLQNISVPFGLHGWGAPSIPITVYVDNILWVPAD
ncbi:MAG: hypothetical protein JW827_07050 [Spirochaetes bacterium]|nr:hypothetical protein [Spirochaetota bacterium]